MMRQTTSGVHRLSDVSERYGPFLVLLSVGVLLAIAVPEYFLSAQNLGNIGRQVSVNSLLALGQLLPILAAGIDLSVGAVMALSMVVLAIVDHAGLPPALVVITPLAVGLICGTLNGVGLVALRLPHAFIMTLAMLNIARGATNLASGGVPISGLNAAVRWLGSGEISVAGLSLPVPFLLVVLCYIAVGFMLYKTPFGRHVYAVGGNIGAARNSGIDVNRVRIIVYTMFGGLAGAAGLVLAGRTNSGYPNAGLGAELDAIAAVIIGGGSFFGGRGRVEGVLAGALIIGLFRNGLNLLDVSVFWQQVLIGVWILGAVAVDVARGRLALAR